MLTRFEVKGFKSLVDVAVDLGAVNVFIGANGSGKSNLLEAIGFISSIAYNGIETETLRYRGVRTGEPSSFRSAITGKNVPQKISIKTISGTSSYYCVLSEQAKRLAYWPIEIEEACFPTNNFIQRMNSDVRISFENAVSIHFNEPIPTEFSLEPEKSAVKSALQFLKLLEARSKIPNLHDFDEDNYPTNVKRSFVRTATSTASMSKHIHDLSNYLIFNPSTPQLRGLVIDIEHDPLGLGGSGLGRAVEEMMAADPEKLGPFEMHEVLDLIEWADYIGTNAPENGLNSEAPIRLRIGDRFTGNGHKTVSAIEASEGALYVLFLLALVGHERSPKMFAVDNFDQAMHPRLARALTEMICDQILADGTRQMFATTHNPLVLNGLNILDDRIRLFTVDRDETGASQIRRVQVTEEIMAKAHEGFSLAELWTMGRFGGVPQNL